MLSVLARKTGDRNLDVQDDIIEEILSWMGKVSADKKLRTRITEKTGMQMQDKNQQFGERLPSGLVLK